ncbi:hypothetical protein ACLI09_07230 [Flavobacterium sp. RHBU_24]|uniref:hypothetical protein n=1 Tax=Flavobacterium sp. RHBU_24 TaxID=3391185 RepID=UPI0039846981
MKYFIFLLLLVLTGCGRTDERIVNGAPPARHATGKLIPIDFKDSLYYDLASYARDTVTNDGWKISYLVKDDTTRYNDLYIQWEKGTLKRVYKDSDVLQMRRYFIPDLSKENKTHIFLEHACATGCWAVLVLPKDTSAEVKDFEAVFDYNTDLGQVVYRKYDQNDALAVSATDLNRGSTKSVTYKNKGYALGSDMAPLDTVIFKGDRIIIDCEVYDLQQDKNIIERQVIRF